MTSTIAVRAKLSFLVLLFSGCVSYNNHYVEPIIGDKARIRISTNGVIRIFPGSTCIDWENKNIGTGPVDSSIPILDKVHNGKLLGMQGKGQDNLISAELYIKAGEPVTIHFIRTTGTSFNGTTHSLGLCETSFTFTPEVNVDYAGVFQSTAQRTCQMNVYTLNMENKVIPNQVKSCEIPKK